MPGRKLFVSLGAFGFFRRNVIVFKSVGGKGGRGGVNHRILVELRDRRLSDFGRFRGHESIVRVSSETDCKFWKR